MASGPITSWQIDGVGTMRHFIFLGSKITADGECSHEIKRHLLLRRKAMTNLDSIIKSRDRSRGHLHPEPSLGQSGHRQKKKKSCFYVLRIASVVSNSLRPFGLACQSSLLGVGRGFSRQKYWSVLANRFPYPSKALYFLLP